MLGVTNFSTRRCARAASPPSSAVALLGLTRRAEPALTAAARVVPAGRVDDDGAGGRVDRAAGEGRGEERQGDQCFHGVGLSVM